MGESVQDRLEMLRELANMDPQPDSVPINALVAVEGTPLADREFVDGIEFVRIIATARILMPKAMVRLSAGRTEMSEELLQHCKQGLAKYKYPRWISFVESLPKTATGKIQRFKLR